jgi:beta-1,4-mannosyl-glycoprotein beta-1,4-N-acetylglucosaminyltransferase
MSLKKIVLKTGEPMIWDCFTFFNELELLEIRLNTLDKFVDKFVLAEAPHKHSGEPKPLYYNENKLEFKKFREKIIHVVVDDIPVNSNYWIPENFQRNAIIRGLTRANPDDIILISDLDEIPRPEKFGLIKSTGITIFLMDYYVYYLNSRSPDEPQWTLGTRAVHLKEMVSPQETRLYGCRREPIGNKYAIFNGGWHFSYLGGEAKTLEKILTCPDRQLVGTHPSDNMIQNKILIQQGRDPMGWRTSQVWGYTPIDFTFPQYVIDNQEKFSALILKEK